MVDEIIAHIFINSYAWNKLYNRKLFDDIRYPEGRVYEDVATTYRLMHKAKRIIKLNDCLYFHVIRKGSITHTHTFSNMRDGFISYLERQKELISYGVPEEKIISCGAAIGFLTVTYPCYDPLYLKAEEIVKSVKGYPKELTSKQKIGLATWRFNKKLFYFICKKIGRI